jgi:uncharacterized protein YbjT (DUF2867 family)
MQTLKSHTVAVTLGLRRFRMSGRRQPMILITAAAGQTGTRIISHLAQRKLPVRGLVTNRQSALKIEGLGAEAVVGDLRDPKSLAIAMSGVTKVYHIAPTLTVNEHAMGQAVISAAQNAGVRHFVLHGVIAPYLQHINYHWAKQLIQFDLYRSGLAYTVLLPANFMQNVSWTWPAIAREGRWELPYSTSKKLTWVDVDDVAEAAANVLTQPGHDYGTYELCGSQSYLSRDDIAKLMSAALGRDVTAVKTDVDVYLNAARSQPFFARMAADELDQIRAMFVDYDSYGMPAGNPNVLSMLLGRPAGSYQDFVAKLARRPHGDREGSLITDYSGTVS